ncbi:MAG TPA: RNA polymerase sigma factor [Terriglobales bacterium]|nr:RNA polymerase sigma factor [Terriglobales bacterium]
MSALCSYLHGCSGTSKGGTDLIQRVRAHDEIAFRSLVEQYQSEIFAFTYALTGDQEEADQLAQKIFVRAYRDSRPGATFTTLRVWLYRLAFEECVLHGRSNALKSKVKRVFARAQPSTKAQGASQPRRATVRKSLEMLSPRARILLLLREVAHQSVSEVAQITGADVNVVKKELLNARLSLSVALEQQSRRI